jgi:hypothetical protein
MDGKRRSVGGWVRRSKKRGIETNTTLQHTPARHVQGRVLRLAKVWHHEMWRQSEYKTCKGIEEEAEGGRHDDEK